MHVVIFIAGLLVVLTTWASLVATLVLPRGRTLFQRGSWLVVRTVQKAFVAAARVLPGYEAKDALLAVVGPAALLAQLAAFLGFFALGGWLMLWPWSGAYGLAFRQSVAALLTVGLDHVGGPTNDAVLVAIAVSGAVTIALQIGYLPVLYQAFARRETLVTLMESRAGIPAWGPEVLMRHQLVRTLDELPPFYRDWELWAADVAESHSTYSALLMFRSPEAGYSWLLSLLAVLDAAALQLALCPTAAPSQARMCLRMGFTTLRRMARTLGWHYDPDPSPDGDIDLRYDEFASAVAQIAEVGFPVERTAEEAWPHFVGWRVNYESIAYRLADFLVAPHAPWSGPRRHLPPDVVPPDRPPHRAPGGVVHDAQRFRPQS
jgi:hypothetical protein